MKKVKATLYSMIIAAGMIATHAQAQQNHTARMIFTSAPSSGSVRLVESYEQCLLSQKISMVKEFKPGAQSLIGIQALLQSNNTPDTTNVVVGGFGTNSLSNFPGLDIINDVSPVGYVGRIDFAFFTKEGTAKTFSDLATHGKTKPVFVGASTSLATFLTKSTFNALGITYELVQYKSNATMTLDLLAGRIDVIVDTFTAGKPFYESGKMHVVSSTMPPALTKKYGHQRLDVFVKNDPAVDAVISGTGVILSVKPDTSSEAKSLLVSALQYCSRDKATIAALESYDSYPVTLTPAQIREVLITARTEYSK